MLWLHYLQENCPLGLTAWVVARGVLNLVAKRRIPALTRIQSLGIQPQSLYGLCYNYALLKVINCPNAFILMDAQT